MSEELSNKNKRSKKHTDLYRPFFAFNRNTAGFTKKKKEMICTLVCDKGMFFLLNIKLAIVYELYY